LHIAELALLHPAASGISLPPCNGAFRAHAVALRLRFAAGPCLAGLSQFAAFALIKTSTGRAAERPAVRSHAERGNEVIWKKLMVVSGLDRMLACAAVLVAFLALVAPALAQERQEAPPRAGEANVVEVVLEGNSSPLKKLPRFSTRAGQPFDPRLVEDDVRSLHRSGRFIDIKPKYQRVPDGLVVIFQVVERPIIRKITYVGRRKVSQKQLEKQSELKVGDALDPHMIEDARRRIERYYHEHGFAKASVTVVEGTQIKDREVVFLVNEGAKQRIWSTRFEGSTIASPARLRTQIQSKPGIFWFLGGYVDPNKINKTSIA
jgi:outer membrane protein assembly factor BamA